MITLTPKMITFQRLYNVIIFGEVITFDGGQREKKVTKCA